MRRVSAGLDSLLNLLWWVLLGVSILTKDAWLFAPAAFFLLLDKLDEQ